MQFNVQKTATNIIKSIWLWLILSYMAIVFFCIYWIKNYRQSLLIALGILLFIAVLIVVVFNFKKIKNNISNCMSRYKSIYHSKTRYSLKKHIAKNKKNYIDKDVHVLINPLRANDSFKWVKRHMSFAKKTKYNIFNVTSSDLETYIEINSKDLDAGSQDELIYIIKKAKSVSVSFCIEYSDLIGSSENIKDKTKNIFILYSLLNKVLRIEVILNIILLSEKSSVNSIINMLANNSLEYTDLLYLDLELSSLSNLDNWINVINTRFCIARSDYFKSYELINYNIVKLNSDLIKIKQNVRVLLQELALLKVNRGINLVAHCHAVECLEIGAKETNDFIRKIFTIGRDNFSELYKQKEVIRNKLYFWRFSILGIIVLTIIIYSYNCLSNYNSQFINVLAKRTNITDVNQLLDLYYCFKKYENSISSIVYSAEFKKIKTRTKNVIISYIENNIINKLINNSKIELDAFMKAWGNMSYSEKCQNFKAYISRLAKHMYYSGVIRSKQNIADNNVTSMLMDGVNLDKTKLIKLIDFYNNNVDQDKVNKSKIALLAEEDILLNFSNYNFIYDVVISESKNLPEYRLFEVLPTSHYGNIYYSQNKISKLYTRVGALNLISEKIDSFIKYIYDNYQFDGVLKLDVLKDKIYDVYWINYLDNWNNLVNSIKVKKFSNISNARYNIVSSLVETNILEEISNNIFKEYEFMHNNSNILSNNSHIKDITADLTGGFNKFSQVVKDYKLIINELMHEVETNISSKSIDKYLLDSSRTTPVEATSNKAKKIINKSESLYATKVYNRLFIQPINELEMMLSNILLHKMQAEWKSIYLTYNNLFDSVSYYPVREFVKMYQPKSGLISKFYNKYINNLKKNGFGLNFIAKNLSDSFVSYFGLVSNMQKLLFDNNGNLDVDIEYMIQPNPNIIKISGSFYDSNFQYMNGPPEWYKLYWPFYLNKDLVSIKASAIHGNKNYEYSALGEEALFDFLKRIKVQESNINSVVRTSFRMHIDGSSEIVNFLWRTNRNLDLSSALKFFNRKIPESIM